MTTYRVYLRSDIQWAMRSLKARSPQHAIKIARRYADKHYCDLDFETYQGDDFAINEIEVSDEHGNELAVWYDDDLRLRLAATDLLTAAKEVVARWGHGDLAAAVRNLAVIITAAKGGAS